MQEMNTTENYIRHKNNNVVLSPQLLKKWQHLTKEEEERIFMLKLQIKFEKSLKKAIESTLYTFSKQSKEKLLNIIYKRGFDIDLFELYCKQQDIRTSIDNIAGVFMDR